MPKHNLYITQTREPEHQKCDKPIGSGDTGANTMSSCSARRTPATTSRTTTSRPSGLITTPARGLRGPTTRSRAKWSHAQWPRVHMPESRRDPAKLSGQKATAWAKQQHCANPLWHRHAQAAMQLNPEQVHTKGNAVRQAWGGWARHG